MKRYILVLALLLASLLYPQVNHQIEKVYYVLEVDLPTMVYNLAINKDKRFENVLATVSSKIETNSDLDFFPVFQNEIDLAGLRLHRYFGVDFGGNVDEIMASLREQADDYIDRVFEILQNRLYYSYNRGGWFSKTKANIRKLDNNHFIVELLRIQDLQRARNLLQTTALLEFVLVKSPKLTNDMLLRIDQVIKGSNDFTELTNTDVESVSNTKPEAVSDDKTISVSDLFGEQAAQSAADTSDTAIVVDQNLLENRPFSSLLRALGNDIGVPEKNLYIIKKILAMEEVQDKLDAANGQFLLSNYMESFTSIDGSQERIYRMYYLEAESELTGGVIEKAKATIGGTGSTASGQAIVLLEMNDDGARTWSRVTSANIGRRVVIVLDKKVHMAPVIRSKISDGGTMIEGFANLDEAKDIAIVLRAGALPAPVNIIEERIVESSKD